MTAFRVGTRGSPLAMWQARSVAAALEAMGHRVEIRDITTTGDRLQHAPLNELGGKRLFVKEIEDALAAEHIDIAVHSAKDMSAVMPDGLEIAAVLPREDPRDAIVLPKNGHGRAVDLDAVLHALGGRPLIGTSSARRMAQIASWLRGARFEPIRGNVDTRLRKLDDGGYDCLVLAAAGLKRLGLESRISAGIPVTECVPAPGQGIIAIQIRSADNRTREAVTPLDDRAAAVSLVAERAVVSSLGGGCQLPLGAIAIHDDAPGETVAHFSGRTLTVHAVVTSPDGGRVIAQQLRGAPNEAARIGAQLAQRLTESGAGEILDDVRRSLGIQA